MIAAVFWVLVGIWVRLCSKVRDWIAPTGLRLLVLCNARLGYMKEPCWVMCDVVLPAKIEKGVAMVVKIYCLRIAFVCATISYCLAF